MIRVSSPLLVKRYCAQLRTISSTSIVNFPISHAFSRRSILPQIAPELVACGAHWRVTVWKMVNLSELHNVYQTLVGSAASVCTKWHPTLPLGIS